jgi:hypothetical protein
VSSLTPFGASSGSLATLHAPRHLCSQAQGRVGGGEATLGQNNLLRLGMAHWSSSFLAPVWSPSCWGVYTTSSDWGLHCLRWVTLVREEPG